MTEDSQAPAEEASLLVLAARREVKKIAAPYRRFLAAIGVVCVLLVIGGVVLGITLANVNADNYNSCLAGNAFRANDQLRWDDFIGLLTSGNAHPNPTALKEAHQYLALVAKTDARRDC